MAARADDDHVGPALQRLPCDEVGRLTLETADEVELRVDPVFDELGDLCTQLLADVFLVCVRGVAAETSGDDLVGVDDEELAVAIADELQRHGKRTLGAL